MSVKYSNGYESKNLGKQSKRLIFKNLSTQYLVNTFELKRVKNSPILKDWLEMPYNISTGTHIELATLRDKLDFNWQDYNEGELKWKYLYPLFNLADHEKDEQYNTFIGRTIKATIKGKKLKGKVDYILSSSEFEPVTPFFLLQEYHKKEEGTTDDIIGRLLSAMLVAQKLNKDNRPIYGSYVISGRLWFFVVLEGKEYSISSGHIGSNDDIFEVYGILYNVRKIIKERLIEQQESDE